MKKLYFAVSCLLLAASAAAQPIRFDDVIRNLRNPDPNIRVDAVRLLRDARYPEAIGPMAALVTDPVDQIQLEAIAAELAFYLVDDVADRKRFAFFVEKRSAGRAAAAFDAGPLAAWPRPVPNELIRGLLQAADDENAKVRIEAIYALGVVARPPFPQEFDATLIKVLDHYDPAMRAAAARVIARLEVKSATAALMTAVNDSNGAVRYAAMRALGALRDESAVNALTEQLKFYGKGEGAWSAIDALARIGHASSVPVFKARLTDKDAFIRRAAAEGLGRAGATAEIGTLEIAAGTDPSEMVRAAVAFALQKMGRNYIPRLAEFMKSEKTAPQVSEYFVELGPSIVPTLASHLQDADPAIRGNVAIVLGAIGGDVAVAAIQPLTQDRDKDVAKAAARALERAKMKK
jgi:HEAT repeat protein